LQRFWRLVWRLFLFTGRADRREYWLVAIGANLTIFGSAWLTAMRPVGLAGPFLVPSLVAIVLNLAVAVRRLHDRGKTGWWTLIWYAAPAAATMWAGRNADRDIVNAVLGLGVIVTFLWCLVELGFMPGDPAANRHGDPPGKRLELSVFD
jgi:uncharacterized membrane protein YhaH (DUF805 family)